MITRVLIANRGEIVSRVINTCRKMGIETVAVYSEADSNAPYLREVDQAVLIGPANPVQSYLNIEAIVRAAKESGADAIHPGYGFLSERGAFAEAIETAGITWVGPSPKLLRVISSKSYCRVVADQVGVPTTPGTLEIVENVETIVNYGNTHGWPIFLKLDKGGGGKGIEKVGGADQAESAFQRVSRVGEMAFGSGACYIESIVEKPRHIEVQFLADGTNCVCLGERECSVQRRHQKIIEEAPSKVVSQDDRSRLFDWTRRIVEKLGYTGAGTIEFLRSEDGDYYFMEINARLQVEHPVTEYLTGIDIVKEQLLIASGQPLSLAQDDVHFSGHAIEARVYAEDPVTFFPSPGTITALDLPEQNAKLRIDHSLERDITVPPYYDPLLAKVIAWDSTREGATTILAKALAEFRVEGVKTSIPLNLKILNSSAYQNAEVDTHFIDRLL